MTCDLMKNVQYLRHRGKAEAGESNNFDAAFGEYDMRITEYGSSLARLKNKACIFQLNAAKTNSS